MNGKARNLFALLAVGALSLGVAACGSGSSSDANNSTSAVEKQAGSEVTADIRLTVINDSPDEVGIGDVCAETDESRCVSDACGTNTKANCQAKTIASLSDGARIGPLGFVFLNPNKDGKYVDFGGRQIWQPNKPGSGASVTAIGDPVDLFRLSVGGRDEVVSRSTNPTVGEPWISVDPSGTLFGDITKWHLAEGQTQDTTVNGTVFFLHRDSDESRPYPEPDLKVMTLTIDR